MQCFGLAVVGEHGCVLDSLNGELSIACENETMMPSHALSKRYSLYEYMASLILSDIPVGETVALPRCVLIDIQATFPERDKSHFFDESVIEFRRPRINPSLLVVTTTAADGTASRLYRVARYPW